MIGSICGRIVVKAPPQLLIEVGGIGYEIEAPMSTFYGLPGVGEEVRLLTHLVVREDAHILYGFSSAAERLLFRNLLKVSGVGPKIALAILSGTTAEGFASCVTSNDVNALTKIPGVGRKTAERLIIEMRDRLSAAEFSSLVSADTAAGGAEGEAFAALVALGYKSAEASRLIKAVTNSGSEGTEDLIRRALQGALR
ncbi:MAG: Holliday junction branch migration protein RuvA [Gammaproteobacteria bacterium]|nr:Holliday junction branch migration protein RuvA [Gammaproteobacteria bacterium]